MAREPSLRSLERVTRVDRRPTKLCTVVVRSLTSEADASRARSRLLVLRSSAVPSPGSAMGVLMLVVPTQL